MARAQQDRNISTSQNLSTVAIFFSGVNATTIQYTISTTQTNLSLIISLLWILSLVLSAASAVGSQLSIHWFGSSYRTPEARTPRIITNFTSRAPIILLGLSTATFMLGIVLFSFQEFSGHPLVLPIIVAVFATLASSVVAAIGLWQMSEWLSVHRLEDSVLSCGVSSVGLWSDMKGASIAARREFGALRQTVATFLIPQGSRARRSQRPQETPLPTLAAETPTKISRVPTSILSAIHSLGSSRAAHTMSPPNFGSLKPTILSRVVRAEVFDSSVDAEIHTSLTWSREPLHRKIESLIPARSLVYQLPNASFHPLPGEVRCIQYNWDHYALCVCTDQTLAIWSAKDDHGEDSFDCPMYRLVKLLDITQIAMTTSSDSTVSWSADSKYLLFARGNPHSRVLVWNVVVITYTVDFSTPATNTAHPPGRQDSRSFSTRDNGCGYSPHAPRCTNNTR